MKLYVLALHIIFVVAWFSGLFYIVRLFSYHAEAEKRPEPEKSILQRQYKIMEKRLWYIISWPSMIGVYVFGGWMVYDNYTYYLSSPWFILKLALVFGLTLYHIRCQVIVEHLQKDVIPHSSFRFRLFNEVSSLFLVAIVFVVVMKDTLSWVWAIIGLILFAVTLYLAAKIYRKKRESKEDKDSTDIN